MIVSPCPGSHARHGCPRRIRPAFLREESHMSVSPIVGIAAGSVIVFSAVGVGVMTGVIPSSFSSTVQQPEPTKAAVASPSATAPAAAPAPQATRPNKVEQAKRSERTRVAAARACANCGTVKSINVVEHAGEGTGVGAIGGAVVGGV